MLVRALYRQGWTKSALAREFGLNRRTVARYVDADEAPAYRPRHCPADLAPDQLAHVKRRLEVCPMIRATTLYREVKELGYQGSYPSFARRVRALRPSEPKEAVVRFETGPGVQAQMDWAEMGSWPLGTGTAELKALVGILGFSRAPAFRFALDKTRATSLRLTPLVLSDLGGSTTELLTDRDPAFVIGQAGDGRAVFASEWVDLTLSLGTAPKACRPNRAKTKGKIERMIREIKEDFLAWLSGQALPAHPTLADYDDLAPKWVDEVVMPRRHRTTGRVVSEAWAEERLLLAPIPERLIAEAEGACVEPTNVIELARAKAEGAVVEHRPLEIYGKLAQ